VSIIGKASSVSVATCLLLMIKLLHADHYIYPVIEKNGMFLGLVILIAAILIPIANGNITIINIRNVLTSWIGLTAIILSFFTTYISGLGFQFLSVQNHSDIMTSLIIGAVAAAALLGGVPVGPLITSGILAIIVKAFNN
jgi:uncharacterized membrane protein (DUF441 family)